jgi:hypothetical protein
LGSLEKYHMLKTANQKANMRLAATCILNIAIGVAADTETRRIQGRGIFLHRRVIKAEKTRKEM